jgi:Flp pilus assembly protein TadD
MERGRGLLAMAHELDPRNAHILADLATSHLVAGEYKAAQRYAGEARIRAPDDPMIQSLSGVTEQFVPDAESAEPGAKPRLAPLEDRTLKEAVDRMTEAAQRAGRPGLVMSTRKWEALVRTHLQDVSTGAFAKDILAG